MPSDYQRICIDNIRRRGEEFDDIGRLISEQLYSDRTHFVFELLQNAEDALERRHRNDPENKLSDTVKFVLFKDRLEFRHFGELFSYFDVKGISDILKGTKSEDKTQIGKFGIGFKSVYAFTSTPEIHSGDEHFIIERYIRPRLADKIPEMSDGETVFIFPFNHIELTAGQAFSHIENKLKKIGSCVLLFLKHISEIEWKIDDQNYGQYLKESKLHGKSARKVTVIGQHGNDDEEEEWLVFERRLDIANGSSERFAEVAFKLKEDEKSKKQNIQRIQYSPLNVYFPTKLETRLGFLVQGPYDTTASRSDIEDNEWNKSLINETAVLLTDVLLSLKEMGLLTASLLDALPIRMDDFPEDGMFYLIVEAVHDALIDQELLPAGDGTFVSARNAKLASAEWLRTLLRDEQMKQLFRTENPLKWISGEITERTKHDLWKYVREDLKVEEITPDSFARKIEGSFLEKQTDDWMIAFYTQLVSQTALWKKGLPLHAKQFIRLQDGSHVMPFRDDDSPNAYLPPEGDTEFPVVRREIAKNEKALEFLTNLGFTEPDAVAEVIKRIIPKYTENNPQISDDEHLRDMKKIIHAYSTDSQEKRRQLISKLGATTFVRAENLVLNQIEYKKPSQLYFQNEELLLYFDGNKNAWFVSSEYDACFYGLFKNLRVNDVVYIERKTPRWNGHVVIAYYHGDHERGLDGFDSGMKVVGLKYALTHPTIERSLFIWNSIVVPHSACIRGVVEKSTRQTYENSTTEDRTSEFGRFLIDTAWLPGSDGRMYKPSELTLGDLPESFIRDERVADQLGMKRDIVAKLAEEAGVPAEDIELLRQHPEEFKQWKAAISAQKQKPAFPERASSNPERRRERLAEQLSDAPNKEYEQRDRSVRTTKGAVDQVLWLRNQYKNEAGQMICQVCKEEMPFIKRDGEHYFEAVEALSRDHFTMEHEAQFLALCPLCAAMYKEFVKQDEGAMVVLKNALINMDGFEVPLHLGDLDTSIRFVETHRDDLRTIIQEMG